jgi:excinuclease ABC subunit A
MEPRRSIRLVGVRQNNLKNVTAEFPFKKITVVTGLSGSGKSSLVFDTLYAEGQRRYVESLSTYTRQFLDKMPKPWVEKVENIPPAIALEQKNHVVNSRSTVGTQTEIVDYLRVLYAKIGKTRCLKCSGDVRSIGPQTIFEWALEWAPGKKLLVLAPLSPATAAPAEPKKKPKGAPKKKKAPALSALQALDPLFRTLREQGFLRLQWAPAKGEPVLIDLEKQEPLPPGLTVDAYERGELSVVVDRLRLARGELDPENRARLLDSIEQALAIGRGRVLFRDTEGDSKLFDSRFACLDCGTEHRIPEVNLFSFNSPVGACPRCSGFGHVLELDENLVVPDPSNTLKNGAIDPLSKPSFSEWQKDFFRFCERQGISIGKRYRELTPTQKKVLWEGAAGDSTFPGIRGCFEDLKRYKYKLHVRVFIRRYQNQSLCPECHGARLRPEALCVRVGPHPLSRTP